MPAWIIAFQTAGWEPWWVGIGALLSIGAGLVLGRFIWGRHAASAVPSVNSATSASPAQDEDYWREKRSSPRYQVRARKVLLAESPDHADRIEAVLLNRSLGGLGLSTDRQVEAGKSMHVCLCESDDDTRWLPIEVRYCRPERGRWALGCKFV
jgi:hypothetical protein